MRTAVLHGMFAVTAVFAAASPFPADAADDPSTRRDGTASLLATLPPPPEKTHTGTAAAAAPNGSAADKLMFTFEQVDIRVFTQIVGNFTGDRFVVADDVTGSITVISPEVDKSEAFKLFVKVLESSGLTVVKDGDINRIINLPKRQAMMGTIVSDTDNSPEFGLITRILHLEHVSVGEMKKMLESQLQRKDSISVLEETNHLIVTDTADAIAGIETLVKSLDKPGMARVQEVIPLNNADAAELASQLNAVFAENQTRARQLLERIPAGTGQVTGAAGAPSIVAAKHANKLVVTGTQRQIETVRALVAQMDVPAPTGRGSLNLIELDYIKSDDLAKNITALLEKFSAGVGDSSLARRIAVESVPANNSLIVNATPEDFKEIEALVKRLDVMPRQVHISVLIAEVADSDTDKLGVGITALNAPDSVGDSVFAGSSVVSEPSTTQSILSDISQGIFGQGLTFGIAHGSHLDADGNIVSDYPAIFSIEALKQNNKVKILANPSLGARNNVEAEVSVVDNIPITEATITGSGSDRDIIQNITRMDVGVKLIMTPHIIPGGLVQLDLQPSIEAVTDSGVQSDYAPTISKRSVKTTIMVPDGQTIVIAGLMRTDVSDVKRKIPILGDIPLLGWLFRWKSKSETKTNILIFVTPSVMETADDIQKVRSDLEFKSGLGFEASSAEMLPSQTDDTDETKDTTEEGGAL